MIDKDRASALLAAELAVDVFAISTDTNYVYLDYRKPEQKPLRAVTVVAVGTVSAHRTVSPGQHGAED